MTSPGGSLTASFDQGVRRFSWLLVDQVKPPPFSVIKKPKSELFAITLDQGAGAHWPSPKTTTYSRPPWAKPPSPLKNESFGRSSAASGYVGDATRGGNGAGRMPSIGRRTN